MELIKSTEPIIAEIHWKIKMGTTFAAEIAGRAKCGVRL